MKRFKTSYYHAYFKTAVRRAPARFAVVTACDPLGQPTPASVNRRRDASLRRLLRARGIPHFRVTGGNKDGSHREQGWGLRVEEPEIARELATRFRQDAYFWIVAGRIHLGAASGGKMARAGLWKRRRASWG